MDEINKLNIHTCLVPKHKHQRSHYLLNKDKLSSVCPRLYFHTTPTTFSQAHLHTRLLSLSRLHKKYHNMQITPTQTQNNSNDFTGLAPAGPDWLCRVKGRRRRLSVRQKVNIHVFCVHVSLAPRPTTRLLCEPQLRGRELDSGFGTSCLSAVVEGSVHSPADPCDYTQTKDSRSEWTLPV